MKLTDEILKLKELHGDGTLTDAEFAQAKAALLAGSTSAGRRTPPGAESDNTLGAAANRMVKFQIVMGIVGVVLALLFFFGIFLPHWNKTNADFDRRWNEFPLKAPTGK